MKPGRRDEGGNEDKEEMRERREAGKRGLRIGGGKLNIWEEMKTLDF